MQSTLNSSTAVEVQRREHLLNRFGYGGTPDQRERYEETGPIEWVMEQIEEAATVEDWQDSPAALQDAVPNGTGDDAIRLTVKVQLERCVSEEQSLGAVLRDFWFNHFNVYAKMGVQKHQLDSYLNKCITPNIVGSFEKMLRATAIHPAMMHYLDNKKNHYLTTSEIVNGSPLFVGPNQNYAREVMELHTLGVDSGYTQTDIAEMTRLLSGFSSNFQANVDNRYEWRPSWHDPGPKTILGHTIQPAGESELDIICGILTNERATSIHVGGKMLRRFVGENANEASLVAVANTFASTTGDLKAVMETLATLPQMHDPAIFRTRLKPPHRFIASAFRTVGLEPAPSRIDFLVDEMLLLGDAPFFYGPPTGYPDDYRFWLTGDGMLARAQIAQKIAQDPAVQQSMPTRSSRPEIVAEDVLAAILPGGVSDNTRSVVTNAVSNVKKSKRRVIAIEFALTSPEFMRY